MKEGEMEKEIGGYLIPLGPKITRLGLFEDKLYWQWENGQIGCMRADNAIRLYTLLSQIMLTKYCFQCDLETGAWFTELQAKDGTPVHIYTTPLQISDDEFHKRVEELDVSRSDMESLLEKVNLRCTGESGT